MARQYRGGIDSAPASKPAWQRWADGELAYTQRRGRHAVKVALACTIALLITVRYDWGHPAWVLMMILPGMQPVVGAAIQIFMARLAAVVLGGVLSLVVVATFVQEPVQMSAALGLVTFAIVYAMASPAGTAVFMNVAITIPVVTLVAFSFHEQLEVVVFDRVVTLLFGAIIGLAVSVSLWPVRALDELKDSVRPAFDAARKVLDARFASLLAATGQGPEELTWERGSAQRMLEHVHLLAQARAERRPGEDLVPRYLGVVVRVESLLGAARSFRLARGASMAECPQALRDDLARARTAVGQAFVDHERGLAGEGPWPPPTAALDDSIARLEVTLIDLWGTRGEGGAAAVRFSALIEGLREIRRNLTALAQEITVLRRLRAGERVDDAAPSAWPATEPGWRALLRIDPGRVRLALKGAIAGLAAFYVSEGLDIWPVLAMVFAPLVAAAPTTSAARLSAIVFFFGTAAGIGLAWLFTIFLTPALETAPLLARLPGLTFVCIVVFGCVGYLMGGKRLAPFAMFMGIFFGVLAITGQTKATTLDSHWTFLVSIWTAVVVGLAVNWLVWPMTAMGKLRPQLAGFLDAIAGMERSAQGTSTDANAFREEVRAFARRYLQGIEVQLKLAGAAQADKAVTRAQVAGALGHQQRLFDVSFALARMRLDGLTVVGQELPEQQRVVTEATVDYLSGLARRLRSPGVQPALPDLDGPFRDLIQKWRELLERDETRARLSAGQISEIRTSIERRGLLIDSLHAFASWLDAEIAAPVDEARAPAIAQGPA